jgi:propanol-preferring alcohol dehydrogenase
MRAVRLVDWKHEPELVDVAEPKSVPGEVRVRIGGAGACHSDLIRAGALHGRAVVVPQ